MTFRKYFEIGKMSFRSSVRYVGDILGSSIFLAALFIVFILMWTTVFKTTSVIEGFTLNMMLWYLVMSEAIVSTRIGLVRKMGEEIQAGTIANKFSKPYNYILYQYAQSSGISLLRFCIIFLLGAIMMLITIGPINISLASIPFIFASAMLAAVLNLAISSLLGVFTFWLEDAKAIEFIYDKLVFILGGMLLPLDMFPEILKNISSFLPFSYIAYHPSKLFVAFNFSYFWEVIAMQMFWIALFITGTFVLYNVLVKRLSANGG